jgi:hypothetical protein
MDVVLLAIRVLLVVALYAFFGVVLVVLLREQRPAQVAEPVAAMLVRLSESSPADLSTTETTIATVRGAHAGERHRLGLHGPTWIGRDPNCVVQVNDDFVSSRHARVDWRGDKQAWWIEDNASRNGTLVNGACIIRSELRHGDVVTVGSAQFRFIVEGR